MEKKKISNREAIERWAKFIIPAVFKAEDALQRAVPEWKERLRDIKPDEGTALAEEYCLEIAKIIVRQGTDYDPADESDKDL